MSFSKPCALYPKPSDQGFTLIELLLVIAIIGMVASIVLTSLGQARLKSRDAKRIADLKQIQTALEQYYDDIGVYPQCSAYITAPTCDTGYVYPSCSTAPSGSTRPLACLSMVPTYIRTISDDPLNSNGSYGYYYWRGYRVTQGSNIITSTGNASDYVLGTRVEGSSLSNTGGAACRTNTGANCWNNSNINYLVGNTY